MEKFDERIEADVLVVEANRETRYMVIALIKKVSIGAFNADMIQNAVIVETMTAALIAINIHYKVKGACLRLIGVPRA